MAEAHQHRRNVEDEHCDGEQENVFGNSKSAGTTVNPLDSREFDLGGYAAHVTRSRP
jgi:hypothetical protein